MDSLIYQIGITLIEGIGDITAKKIIAYCGGAEAVFKEKKSALIKIPGIGATITRAITGNSVLSLAEKEATYISQKNIQTFYFLDDNYPFRLKHCEDGPILLYARGDFNLNSEKVISIVGTRNATDYGKSFCNHLVEALLPHNPLIVSGLAYGIDICAHRAAIKNELYTVGVLAHGLDSLYPRQHQREVDKMLEKGGLLTDFISGTNSDRENFPKRNRIVAGVADATIVIESAHKGGSLITADIANSYNRDVFAVPGKVGDKYSEGCNKLIKINKAHLLESTADIIYLMGWETKKTSKSPVQKQLFVNLGPEEETLINVLKEAGKLNVDQLGLKAGMPASQVSSTLLQLEFSGMVKVLPGKIYELS